SPSPVAGLRLSCRAPRARRVLRPVSRRRRVGPSNSWAPPALRRYGSTKRAAAGSRLLSGWHRGWLARAHRCTPCLGSPAHRRAGEKSRPPGVHSPEDSRCQGGDTPATTARPGPGNAPRRCLADASQAEFARSRCTHRVPKRRLGKKREFSSKTSEKEGVACPHRARDGCASRPELPWVRVNHMTRYYIRASSQAGNEDGQSPDANQTRTAKL